MSAYTPQVVVGSLFGSITLGIACAAFVPLLVMNAINRRNGASPGFVFVWLVGDVVNTVGLARAGATETQIALAAWYGVADLTLLVQLLCFGHRSRGAPRPKSTRALIAKLKRREKPWWDTATRRFRSFGFLQDFVLLTIFVLVATTAWGATMLSKLAKNPDEPPLSAVHEWDSVAFLLGMLSSLIFCAARLPEFAVGFIRDSHQLEPEQGMRENDPLFAFMIIENCTNIVAILALSLNKTYLVMEIPWLLGSALSIVVDISLILCIRLWRRRFYRDDNPNWLTKKREREEQDQATERLKSEIEERREEGLLLDILGDVDVYRRTKNPSLSLEAPSVWERVFGNPDIEAYMERAVLARNFEEEQGSPYIHELLRRIEQRTPPYDEGVLAITRQALNNQRELPTLTFTPSSSAPSYQPLSASSSCSDEKPYASTPSVNWDLWSKWRAPSSHPSTEPFLRAVLLGWAAQSFPALVRVLLAASTRRSPSSLRQLGTRFLAALCKGLHPRGLGVAFGIAIGGARWAESLVEPAVRRAYLAAVGKTRALREGKGKARETEQSLADEQQRAVQDERNIRALATFASAALSSLAALLILQSSPSYRRPTRPTAALANGDDLDFLVTPYTPSLPASAVDAPADARLDSRSKQSPTLDLTLFVLVRAADTLARAVYERAPPASGQSASLLRFLADQGDTIVFAFSSARIMHAWFYAPHLLPPSYSGWILRLARMDPRLLQLLRFARTNRYVYGQEPDAEVAQMCAGIAAKAGRDAGLVNPQNISRLNCSFVHGKLGAGSCEANAVKRWARAFLDALMIYLPVHAIPPLLFSFRRTLSRPRSSLIRILLAASRSSAFLATFVASIYASVCLVRTRVPGLLPSVPQQPLDSGLCVLAGCLACGFSVLIENKRRRREMALYVAPRALYAILDELAPSALLHSRAGELAALWTERLVFALSSGTVVSAAVHRPDLVSGVVRGVTGFAVGGWRKEAGLSGQ
ncbi:uncharacterized protein JCM10292_004486 [Rhodotorula paludigena]|uniref:uncharacterized protein n=1 Tax=Rhodotorula paludigena TaxID=86838 RepID=UPI00316B770E